MRPDQAGTTSTPGAIQTYTGRFIQPLCPHPDDVRIEDIAHALAMICRFGGHCQWHYSVAQHSCLVHDWLRHNRQLTLDREWLAFAGLLHDAAEAYLGDVPRPLKLEPAYDGYAGSERAMQEAVWLAFDVPEEYRSDSRIKRADSEVCRTEANALMVGGCGSWQWGEIAPADVAIGHWTPEIAEAQFMMRWGHPAWSGLH